jgi:arylsulfatase A-like enzyme
MKAFALILRAALLLGCAILPATAAPQKPNVLFIAVDDLRPDFGAYGNTAVKSPHLDRLAAEGLLFQRAYCQMSICMPSRASVLSGFRPESIKKTGRVSGHVPANTVTLPQLFRNHGYTTVSIGKVYHENNDDPNGWVRRHTDTFYENYNGYCSGYQLPANKATVENYLCGKRKQGLPASNITEITDTPDAKTPDGIIAQRAIEELQKFKKTGEPFFLATGFYRPHLPLTAPKKYWDLYDRQQVSLPANFRQPDDGIPRYDWDEVRRYGDCPLKGPMPEAKAKEIIHGYYASVTFVDAQIGKVLDELRRLGLDKNTIIVLWSDNGWNLGDHGRFSKFTNHESSTRIAMMLKIPWLPGKPATPALTELVDIYPTLAELCRLPAPGYLEGTSVVPLLTKPQRLWKTGVFSCLYKGKERTIRTDRYRLIEHPGGQLELYDHTTDPAEDHNLAKDPAHAGTLKKLQAALQAGWRAAKPIKFDRSSRLYPVGRSAVVECAGSLPENSGAELARSDKR